MNKKLNSCIDFAKSVVREIQLHWRNQFEKLLFVIINYNVCYIKDERQTKCVIIILILR